MGRGIERIRRRIAELVAFDPQSVQKRRPPEVTALQNAIDEALTTAFGHNTVEYRRYVGAARLDNGPMTMRTEFGGGNYEAAEAHRARQYLAEGKQRSLVLLHQAISWLEEEIADREQYASPVAEEEISQSRPDLRKIFVVHGHDGETRATVARFIEKLGFEAVILHERPNKGRTIITKFRDEAAGVGFAVVLMTPDDVGGEAPSQRNGVNLLPRARQNVVFELGFFVGALGPEHVAALVKGDIERPSDFDGVVYISLDNTNWKTELARELEAAGYEIDWKKAAAA
jgi:predicted nucleotide-binding protein